MSKNNQGYFLVETIIVLAIVATIITTLYVNSGQTYIKHKNELTKYNTVDGLYSANAVKKYLYTYEEDLKKAAKENGYTNVNNYLKNKNLDLTKMDFFKELNVNKVYLSLYDMKDLLNDNEIENIIRNSSTTDNAVSFIVDNSLLKGGIDNITALLIEIEGSKNEKANKVIRCILLLTFLVITIIGINLLY